MTENNSEQNRKSKEDKLSKEDKARTTYCQVPILEKVMVPSPGYQTRLYSLQVLSVAEAEQYYQNSSTQWQKNSDQDWDRSQEFSDTEQSQEICNSELSQILCDREQ